MKQKSHSGLKKRIRVKGSGHIKVMKAAKRHLLVNKSKRQKKSFPTGMPVTKTRMMHIRRLLPGIVVLRKKKTKAKAEKVA